VTDQGRNYIIAFAAVLDDLPLVEENRKGRAEIGRGKS
jgi:hypothetical protein